MAWTRLPCVLLCAGLLAAACGEPASPGSPASTASPTEPSAAATGRPAPDAKHTSALAAGLNAVGYDLFHVAAGQSDADVVLSPMSIGVAFGMADAGASGATAKALEELFAYPVAGEQRWSAFNALDQAITDVGNPIVRPANRMFPDEDFETVDGYDEILSRWFGAGIEPLPLQAESELSRARINGWVKERTEDLIPELLPSGFIHRNSVLVLVNALYLEAKWALPFGKYETEDQPFTRLDGSKVGVPLMHELELSGPAVKGDDYAATEVPYQGGKLSMLVIVPDDGRYEEIESQFDAGLVAEIDANATKTGVELWLPRFDSNATLDLKAALQGDLGVKNLFDVPGWDGIAPGITLDAAVHAADIAVDETGTVAAAATALGFAESGPPQPQVTVRADKPFLYLIRHRPTGAVLFVGRVLDPSA